jgi:hypothetical protein
MTKLCCACHSSTIAALTYIIVASDMHGQKVDTATCRLPHVNLHAIVIDEQRQPFICPRVSYRGSKLLLIKVTSPRPVVGRDE